MSMLHPDGDEPYRAMPNGDRRHRPLAARFEPENLQCSCGQGKDLAKGKRCLTCDYPDATITFETLGSFFDHNRYDGRWD